MFSCKTGEHRTLSEVYYIPQLRTNIVSLGQLDENGCTSLIENGELCLYDRQRLLLARVQRMSNRLYAVALNLVAPVSLLAREIDEVWRWHTGSGISTFVRCTTWVQRRWCTTYQ
jgi:hypothetical protein